jgi:hypothetical protein
MGRIAARETVARLKSEVKLPTSHFACPAPNDPPAAKASDPESLRAWREVLRQLVAEHRPGYHHFEKAHTGELESKFDCVQCHGESSPLAVTAEQVDRRALIHACVICHGSVKE